MKRKSLSAIITLCIICLAGCNAQTLESDLDEYTNNEENYAEQETHILENQYIEMPSYEGTEIDAVELPSDISEEEIDARIDEVAVDNPTKGTSRNQRSKKGNLVNFSYQAEDGTSEDNIEVIVGDNNLIESFDEALVGVKAGDVIECEGTLSTVDDPYAEADPTSFTVTINGVYSTEPSEITDDFIKTISDSAGTVDEYRDEIRNELAWEQEIDYQDDVNNEAWDIVLENITVKEYNDDAINEMKDRCLTIYQEEAAGNMMTLEEYIYDIGYDSLDKFNESVEDAMQNYWLETQAADLIIDNENLTDEKIKNGEAALAYLYGYNNADSMKANMPESTYNELLRIYAAQNVVGDKCIQLPDETYLSDEEPVG